MTFDFKIAEKCGRPHPFQNEIAGRAWLDGYLKRNPKLTLRSAQQLPYNRAVCANVDTINAKLAAVCARLNILTKAMQIYNMDECGITVVHYPGKVMTEVGRKNVWSISTAEKGKTHTLLCCVSASGQALPPSMIYPRKLQRPSYSSLPATPSDSSSLGGRHHTVLPYYRKLQRPSYSSLPATPSDSSSLGGRPSYSSLPATPSDSSSLGGRRTASFTITSPDARPSRQTASETPSKVDYGTKRIRY